MAKKRAPEMRVTSETGVTEITQSFLDDDRPEAPKAAKKKPGSGVTLPVEELLPAITLTSDFASDRDLVPGLKQVWFQGTSVRSNSGSAGAVHTTPWTFPGEFALSAAHLRRIVTSLNDSSVEELVLESHEGTIRLRGGRFRAQLGCYRPAGTEDVSLYVQREAPKTPRTALDPRWWGELERVMFTVCRDETKPPLRGVYWSEGGLLLSTDTFRISVLNPPKEYRTPAPKGGLLLPDHLLERLGSRRRDATSVCLEGDATVWFFLGERAAVYGSLLAAGFPTAGFAGALKKVREDARGGGTWVDVTGDLAAAFERLLHFATAPTFRVQGEVGRDSLKLTVAEADARAEEEIPAAVQGEPTTFSVNGKYLKEALEVVGRRFWLPAAGAGTTAYFVSADKRFEHIVMLLA